MRPFCGFININPSAEFRTVDLLAKTLAMIDSSYTHALAIGLIEMKAISFDDDSRDQQFAERRSR